MSRSTRKLTLWTLRSVSTQIRLRSPNRLIWADNFRLREIDVYSNDSLNRKSTRGEKYLIWVMLRDRLKLIRVDTTMLVCRWNVSFPYADTYT